MRKPLNIAAFTLVAGFAAVFAIVEFRHRATFGHFVPLTLHADVTVANADIGIPGITKVYNAHLSNFGIFPRRITRCEFVTDTFDRGISIGYRVEQWNEPGGRWIRVMHANNEYCRPYPLGIARARLTSKWLWPGQTLSTGAEATAARGKLKGETMRFVIVADGREFPTGSFTIDEQLEGTDKGYRLKH
jgi:hypothetical protein